ncbi:MAG TPA: class I tRNA ligase family protein, partial [Candidatus Krumholzibacteria bacterium]|nr:class I tRNA ligase family protein [Candidatus Krumholzibacteria bacterium]
YRFLNRVWRAGERINEAPPTAPSDEALERERQIAIQRVGDDFDRFKFNTVVAALMELLNALSKALEEKTASRLVCETTFDTLLQLLHPIAPHITEELWERRGHMGSVLDSDWPELDSDKLRPPRVTIVIQVDGKLRERLEVPPDTDREMIEEEALSLPKVRDQLEGRTVERVVHVPGRLVNFVTRRTV